MGYGATQMDPVEGMVLDATQKGGLARYVNHSCNPNCETRVVRVAGRRHVMIAARWAPPPPPWERANVQIAFTNRVAPTQESRSEQGGLISSRQPVSQQLEEHITSVLCDVQFLYPGSLNVSDHKSIGTFRNLDACIWSLERDLRVPLRRGIDGCNCECSLVQDRSELKTTNSIMLETRMT